MNAAPAPPPPAPPLRIANASGFYGDRFDAMREMLTGGPLDVLTGDYLAELTMLILGRDRLRDASLGYAKTFLRQLEQCLGLARDRGVRIVTNAGGLNPAGLAERIGSLAARLGVPVRVAYVEGDDLLGRGGWPQGVLTANAYLGGGGIAACLRAGADVVVTGRVTDAALVTGPAAAHFGWDLAAGATGAADTADTADAAGAAGAAARQAFHDRLAGAVVAGHVLECGAQATGGNYAFFARHQAPAGHPPAAHARGGTQPGGRTTGGRRTPGHVRAPRDLRRPGFPIAEIHEDGSCVVTKHDGTGGLVDVGTVTAQLLYETAGARYPGPDVTARLDTVRLTQEGVDRVRIDGVRGEAPPPALKVGLNRIGGWRGEVVFVLTGLDIEAKADLVRAQMEDAFADSRPAEVRWELARTDRGDAATEETASALLRLVVRDQDQDVVGRRLSGAAVELGLASYPGFHLTAPPGKGTPYGVFEAAYADQGDVGHVAVLPDGTRQRIAPPRWTGDGAPAAVPEPSVHGAVPGGGPVRRVPLGLVAGARSGDKGGDANIGVWVRADGPLPDDAYRWLVGTLTVQRLRQLLPECAGLNVVRHVLPNLRALNFVVEGLLGEGVAAQHRFDPQAKGLGEWLRSRRLDVPEALLPTDPEELP